MGHHLGEAQVPGRQRARGPLESSSSGEEVGRNLQGVPSGPSLPTGMHRRGPSRCSLGEVLSEDPSAWEKEEKDPLQNGSLPVTPWVRFPVGGETPARDQGLGARVSVWLCFSVLGNHAAENNFRTQRPNLLILQMKPRGARNVSRSTQLVCEDEWLRFQNSLWLQECKGF